jgi:hypothetical protein
VARKLAGSRNEAPRQSAAEVEFRCGEPLDIFRGQTGGRAGASEPGSRRTAIKVESLGLMLSVPAECIERHPKQPAPGAYSAVWMDDLLKREPTGCAEIGLFIKTYIVPDDLHESLKPWAGHQLGGGPIASSQAKLLAKEAKRLLPAHDHGAVDGARPWSGGLLAETLLGLDLRLKAPEPSCGPPLPPPAVEQAADGRNVNVTRLTISTQVAV